MQKDKAVINLNETILLLLSLTYAGISSNIFFGFRVVDFLIFLFFVLKLKKKIDLNMVIIFGLWLTSVFLSTLIGVAYKAPFVASDLRFFLVFILAAYIGYSVGKQSTIKMEPLFYKLMLFTLIIYCIIPFLDFLRFFYIPESFQKDEHANTIFGPSTIIVNYLFVYLVLVNKNRSFWFYASYLIFALIVYSFRISRTDLALMLLFFIWSVLYRLGERIKLKHVLLALALFIVGVVGLYVNENERIQGLFNPGEDSSFVYRILSNNEFLRQFSESTSINKFLGFGIGSTIDTHFNDWFGDITLTILDNGPLTVMMKTGIFGLLIFIAILYYPLRGFSFKRKMVLIFPILLSLSLFSHVIYNLLYILGFYFICFKLKTLKH